MGFFDFLFKEPHFKEPHKCSPEYIRHRKAELIEQVKQQEEIRVQRNARKDAIIASRNGIPLCGDVMQDGRYAEEVVVVNEVYKGYVIGTAWYCEPSYHKPPKLKSKMRDGVWELCDLRFEEVREDFHTKPMSDRESKHMRFLIDIKKEPFNVWRDCPEYEQKAIGQLAKECYQ